MTNTQADKLAEYLRKTCPSAIEFPTYKSKMLLIEMIANQHEVSCSDISVKEAIDLIEWLHEEVKHG